MSRIHYICHYADPQFRNDLYFSPAACAKIEYVLAKLNSLGYEVSLLSTAVAKNKFKRKKIIVNQNETHRYFSSVKRSGWGRYLSAILFWLQMLYYFFRYVSKEDSVLVYHQLNYIKPLKFLKKIKRFQLILEIEEIHSSLRDFSIRTEIEYCGIADKYLIINNLIREELKITKPNVIFWGDYRLPGTVEREFQNDKINILYAGTIEYRRKAAFNAVEAMNYLPDIYQMHILGFGPEGEIKRLEAEIKKVNDKKKTEAVIFHGLKQGLEFDRFLNSCQIAVSCHQYDEKDKKSEKYSFPSKIIIYLAHNLRVVSSNIQCVYNTPFSDYIFFYENKGNIPKQIAAAVQKIEVNNKWESANFIMKLDNTFERQLSKLISLGDDKN